LLVTVKDLDEKRDLVNLFSHLFSIFFTFPAKSMPPACILLEIYVCHTSAIRPMIPIMRDI